MVDDIRIKLNFRTNKKRKKLQRKLKAEGVLCLIDLWLTIAEEQPSGFLENYSIDDIETDANWSGEPGLFIKILEECKFLEKKGDFYLLHDWDEHQPWVFDSERRGDQSRFSNLAKNNRIIFEELKAKGVDSLTKREYEGLRNGSVLVLDIKPKRNRSGHRSGTDPVTEPEPNRTPNRNRGRSEPKRPPPSPLPSPSPRALKEPGLPAGNYVNLFLKEGNKLKEIALKIQGLKPKKKPFNPHQFIQKLAKDGIHPKVILKCLNAIYDKWDDITSTPYQYTAKMCKNEMDHFITAGYKQETFADIPKEISELLLSFGKKIPIKESEKATKDKLREQAEMLNNLKNKMKMEY